MKNLTVSVPDDVYREARVHAAHQGTSVSALVAEYLKGLARDRDAEFTILLRQQQEVIDRNRGLGFSARDRLTRDEVHDRAALR